MIAVIRWAHTSTHQRALFLREKDLTGGTLFRPGNFAEYVEFATSGGPAGLPLGTTQPQRDPVEAFVQHFTGLQVVTSRAPRLAELSADEVEARRRQAAINRVTWRRWCEVQHPIERAAYLNDLRNAYREAA